MLCLCAETICSSVALFPSKAVHLQKINCYQWKEKWNITSKESPKNEVCSRYNLGTAYGTLNAYGDLIESETIKVY